MKTIIRQRLKVCEKVHGKLKQMESEEWKWYGGQDKLIVVPEFVDCDHLRNDCSKLNGK